MSLLRAPMALRTPISRVRSVTETSMMFITPTPPIRSPIELSTITDGHHAKNDVVELLRRFQLSLNREIVRLVVGDVPPAPQYLSRLIDRLIEMAGVSQDANPDFVARRIQLHKGVDTESRRGGRRCSSRNLRQVFRTRR